MPQDLFSQFQEMARKRGLELTQAEQQAPEEAMQAAMPQQQPSHSWSLSDYLKAPLGVAWDFPKSILQSLGHQAANAVQAVSPVQVPYATDKLREGGDIGGRTADLLSALTFGIPERVSQHYMEQTQEKGEPQNFEQASVQFLKALGKTAVTDILPGQELKEGIAGYDEQGRPLDPRDYARLAAQATAKLLPFGKPLAKVAGVDRILPSKRVTITAGELSEIERGAGLAEALKNVKKQEVPITTDLGVIQGGRKPLPDHAAALDAALTPAQKEATSLAPILDHEVVRQTVAKVGLTDIFNDIQLREAVKPAAERGRITALTAEAIRKGALSEDDIANISQTYLFTPEETAARFADVLEHTATQYGKGLNALSEAQEFTEAALSRKFFDTGDVRFLNQLKKLRDSISGGAPTTMYGKAVGLVRNIEQYRRVMMIGQWATSVRNMVAQGNTALLQVFEDIVGGSIEAVTNVWRKDNRGFTDYFGDLIGDVRSLAQMMTKDGRETLSDLLKSVPNVRRQILDTSSMDVQASLLGSGLGLVKAQLKDREYLKALQTIITTPNHMQETFFRRYFFQGRLESNLRNLGMKDVVDAAGNTTSILKQFVTELQKPELADELHTALADAMDHSLRQTYAWTPKEQGIFKWVLDSYNYGSKVGIPMTALFPPFPRFMINQYRWQIERSPSHWFNMFEKGFRDKLVDAASTPGMTREASRVLGQATNGIFMLNGAWVARNSPIAGPKYYLFDTGQKDEKGQHLYDDIRAYQPFSSYFFLADAVKHIQNNTPMSLTPDEITDAIVGLRRVGDIPMFGLVDLVRNLGSNNPEEVEKTLKSPAGKYFASFFTPLRTLQDLETIGGSQKVGYQKDVQGQELTGPSRQLLEALPGMESGLPVRIDKFTGLPQENEAPGLRQFGITRQSMTPFEKLMVENGLDVNKVLGNYGGQTANSLTAKYFGQILHSIDEPLTANIQKLPSKTQQLVIPLIVEQIRQTALNAAKSEDPQAFLTHEINTSIPQALREDVKKALAKSGFAPKP